MQIYHAGISGAKPSRKRMLAKGPLVIPLQSQMKPIFRMVSFHTNRSNQFKDVSPLCSME